MHPLPACTFILCSKKAHAALSVYAPTCVGLWSHICGFMWLYEVSCGLCAYVADYLDS